MRTPLSAENYVSFNSEDGCVCRFNVQKHDMGPGPASSSGGTYF